MDFQENKILNEYKKFNENKKIISRDFIKNFLMTYINILGYQKYVSNIYVYDRGTSFAVYTANNALSIRYMTIVDYAKNKYGIKEINTIYDAININNEIIKVLFHELTHIKQKIDMQNKDLNPLIKDVISSYKLSKDKQINVESNVHIYNKITLIKDGFKLEKLDVVNNEKNIYKKYHDFFPYEYNANLEGLLNLIEFEKKAGLINNDYQTKNIYLHLLASYITNPFGVKSPLETITELKGETLDTSKYDCLTDYERILYGLPINNRTYQKIMDLRKEKQINFKEYWGK